METTAQIEKEKATVKVELEIEELERIVAPVGKIMQNHNETLLVD